MVRDITHTRNLISQVTEIVCDYFGVKSDVLYEKERSKKTSFAKCVSIFVLHKDLGVTINALSRAYRMTARGIYWNCDKMRNYISVYEDAKISYEKILEQCSKL